jgi:hypothetical protein
MGLYGAYFGIGENDPSGRLKYKNPRTFKGRRDCSDTQTVGITFDWELEAVEERRGGYIIQRVEVYCKQCDCEQDGCMPIPFSLVPIPRFKCGTKCIEAGPIIYFEAWKIGNNKTIPLSDNHTFWPRKKKCTTRRVIATAKYIKSLREQDWSSHRIDFGQGICTASPIELLWHDGQNGKAPRDWYLADQRTYNRGESPITYETNQIADCCSSDKIGPFGDRNINTIQ